MTEEQGHKQHQANIIHQRGISEGYERGQMRYRTVEAEPEIFVGDLEEYSRDLLNESRISHHQDSKSISQRIEEDSENDDQKNEGFDEFQNINHDKQKGLFSMQVQNIFTKQDQLKKYDLKRQYDQSQSGNKKKRSPPLGGEAVGLWIQKQLHEQYFEAFNFYFAKGINEILANLSLPHVILFKDYLFYDDDSEYLKRYYKVPEVPPRLNLLTDFYANQYKPSHPNLYVVATAKIIAKRNYKQAKLFMHNQEKKEKLSKKQKGSKEEYDGVLSASLNQDGQPKKENEQEEKKKKQPLVNLLDKLDQSINYSEMDTHSLTSAEQKSRAQQNQDQSNSTSFQTKEHDIYYPSFSSKGTLQSALIKSIANHAPRVAPTIKLPSDLCVKNPYIRSRGQFISAPYNQSASIYQNTEQQKSNTVIIVQYNELQDLEKELPPHLQVYLHKEKIDFMKQVENDSEAIKQKNKFIPMSNEGSNINTFQRKRLQDIYKNLTLEDPSANKEQKTTLVKSREEDSQTLVPNNFQNKSTHQGNTSPELTQFQPRVQNVRQGDDKPQQKNINSQPPAPSQQINQAAVRGALLAEYLSQENPLSCRASATLLGTQFQKVLSQDLSKGQNTLLNRFPTNVKQQLALNLQEHEQMIKNIKQNQNQLSPDRIWTDRDVNPRISGHLPGQPFQVGGGTVVIGKGEMKMLKSGKGGQQQQAESNDKKLMLSRIVEENNSQKANHQQNGVNVTNNITTYINNKANHNSNANSISQNKNTNQNCSYNSSNNQNVFGNINNPTNAIPNNTSSLQHQQNIQSQKAIQSKIIQNAVSSKMTGQVANVQDVYKKYQQMLEESGNNFQRTSQDLQSFRQNPTICGQPLSFFKVAKNLQGNEDNTQESDTNTNLGIIQQFSMAGINPTLMSEEYTHFINQQVKSQNQKSQKFGEEPNSGRTGNKAKMNAVIAKAASHAPPQSQRRLEKDKDIVLYGKSINHSGSAIQQQQVQLTNWRGSQKKSSNNININNNSNNNTNRNLSNANKQIFSNKQGRASSLIKNLSGDDLVFNDSTIKSKSSSKNVLSPSHFLSQSHNGRKTPSQSSQTGKGFFKSTNNNITSSTTGNNLNSHNNNSISNLNINSAKGFQVQRVNQTVQAHNNYVSPTSRLSSSNINPNNFKSLHSQKSYSEVNQQNSIEKNKNSSPTFPRGLIDLNKIAANQIQAKENNYPNNNSNNPVLSLPANNNNSNNSQTASNNANSNINIHNINNNININNINVPNITNGVQVNSINMNALNLNSINMDTNTSQKSNNMNGQAQTSNNTSTNFHHNTNHMPSNSQNALDSNSASNQQQSTHNNIQFTQFSQISKNTQNTAGNLFSQDDTYKSGSPNHHRKKQKSETLSKHNFKLSAPTVESKSPRIDSQSQQQLQEHLLLQQQYEQQQQQLTQKLASTQRKQELKLNISKIINQQQEISQNIGSAMSYPTNSIASSNLNFLNEDNQENSYGFWTSRSSKHPQSSQLVQNSNNSLKYSSLTQSKNTPNLNERKLISHINKKKDGNYNQNGCFSERSHNQKASNPSIKSDLLRPSPSIRKAASPTINQNNYNNQQNEATINSYPPTQNIAFPKNQNPTQFQFPQQNQPTVSNYGRKSPNNMDDTFKRLPSPSSSTISQTIASNNVPEFQIKPKSPNQPLSPQTAIPSLLSKMQK